MKTLSMFLFLASLVTLTGCSPFIVNYDYDMEYDFTRLSTFDWFDIPQTVQVDELGVKRAKNAVNRQLAAKGLSRVSENPDCLIALHLTKQWKRDVDWGYSSRRYSSYWARRSIDVYEYEEGTLILDFIESDKRELIWRGSVTAVVDSDTSPEKKEKRINEAVFKVLEKFPPSQRK
jgi:hypothetical protein